jgi:DNA repair protein RadC
MNDHIQRSQLRISYNENVLSASLCNSKSVGNFFMQIWDKSRINIQEQVYILYLNLDNRVIGWWCLNTGSTNQTIFDIKLAVACGLNCLASKAMIAHNHPSGILKPSQSDILITNKLYKALKMFDIQLIDHLILCDKMDYFSFADNRVNFE